MTAATVALPSALVALIYACALVGAGFALVTLPRWFFTNMYADRMNSISMEVWNTSRPLRTLEAQELIDRIDRAHEIIDDTKVMSAFPARQLREAAAPTITAAQRRCDMDEWVRLAFYEEKFQITVRRALKTYNWWQLCGALADRVLRRPW